MSKSPYLSKAGKSMWVYNSRLIRLMLAVLSLCFILYTCDSSAQNITTIAGYTLTPGFSGDGGPATSAKLNSPYGIFVDGSGNMYITDSGNQRVRKIDGSTGIISTIAGYTLMPGFSGDGGAAVNAQLNNPTGVCLDASGNVYIADMSNNRIRKVDISGNITTIAGTGTAGYNGDGIAATSAKLNQPYDVSVDGFGNVYIVDASNQRIRKVDTSTGIISTIAGYTLMPGFSGDSGPAINAQLNNPNGVFVDGFDNVYITDRGNGRIRKVDASTGIITTIAGNTAVGGFAGDSGPAINAQLNSASSVFVDGYGNVYIVDTGNNRIRKVDASTGIINTIAGTGTAGFSGDGGVATGAKLNLPIAVSVDGSCNMYITDLSNNRIRKVTNVSTPCLPNVNVVSTNINCTGQCTGTATVTATGGTAPYTYNWSNSESTQSILNLCVGNYTVTVTDAASAVVTYSVSIIALHSLPTLLISPNSAMCIGDVPLSIGAAGAVTYTWHPSTGLSTTTGSPITASPPTGINSYTVTGVDANGCINDTSLTITVNGLPTLFTSPNTTICSGTVSTLSIGGSEAYTWSPSTGLNSTTGSAVQATLPSGTMTYTITGTYVLTGCSADTTITILVNPLPIININPSVITICNGSSTSLSALGTAAAPPINYLWQPTAGLSSNTSATVTASPTLTSTYSVTGTDQNGCYNTATAIVNVNTFLTITTTPANASICTGDNIPISASGATSYTWYPSTALNNNTGSTVTATPTSNISYTITGTDNNGCTGEATSKITVYNLPIITVSSNVTICQGSLATLSASGAINYSWNPATTPATGQIVTAGPNATTNYTVTGTDQNNCSNTATVKVGVSSPTAVIASADVTITMGNTITISATADIGSSFIWSPSSTLSCDTCQSTTASPTISTTYYVTVTNNDGCQSTDSVIVTVKRNCAEDIYVPDAFSPNGDGQNDVLYLKIQNGCIKTISFQIYDRWGAKVFESFDPANGWDGKRGSTAFNIGSGKEYNTAVFVYYLQATLIDGNPINKKGNISLIK